MSEPSLYVIRRGSAEPQTNPGDVYVTGPEFGTPKRTGIYSSTRKVAEASRYTSAEARDLIARKWRSLSAQAIPVGEAEDLA